ncbi:NADH dehydrogenase subunit E [Syntrophobotulus glycolicus DSM 8271]|uniref:NADH dehydrogenase subunit E n=1 Tax=Syntrophobotulus glycolicus (strain DSM 8271 / FlGlyR) TaxID=645991 RepID=F0SXA0_SYNGF|nr:NADH-quinone oxidoreductase subunit NuoE [Syntrophobotulus glycolicus]ADY56960.1 NADH dehydrogenase subunit E [Syntrophobotulus glycolicus DSM 8271]
MCKEKTLEQPDRKKDELLGMIAENKKEPGNLITVLQKAQEIYGHLSEEIMRVISEKLEIPAAEVFGVATFYSQFRFTPMGRNVIRVCMGTACHVRGALNVLRTIERGLGIKAGETTQDGRFTLETVACIGACGLAPVISINNMVYGNMTPQAVMQTLDKYE